MSLPSAPAVRRAFDRAASTYDAAAQVQRVTIDSLLAVLPPMQARAIADVGCGTGLAFAGLRQRFPDAHIDCIDFAPDMLVRAPGDANSRKTVADAANLPLADTSLDLVFSSLTYQWCDLPAVLKEARRVLRPNGLLVFSTLLQGTFRELDLVFSGLDAYRHTLPLLSSAQVDSIVTAEHWSVQHRACIHRQTHHASLKAVLQSIRATGANEVGAQRRPGLLGKTSWQTMNQRYATLADRVGDLPLSYEVLEIVMGRTR